MAKTRKRERIELEAEFQFDNGYGGVFNTKIQFPCTNCGTLVLTHKRFGQTCTGCGKAFQVVNVIDGQDIDTWDDARRAG